MSTGASRGAAAHSLRAGLVAECWAGDLADGARIRGRYAATEPTKNIITHQDFRHVSGTGPSIQRNWNGTGRDRIRFGPGQQLVLVPANAPGAVNDHGKTLKLGFKAASTDGLAKSLSLGQATPGYVAATVPAGNWAAIGSTANVSGAWVFNSTVVTVIKDAGNAKDWFSLAGGPYVFRCKADFGATAGFDVSFTATATDNLVAEIAAQLVTLLNAALNTRNGTSGVTYAAYASGTNAITITNSAIGVNPALGLGKYSLTLTVKDSVGVELTDQFHETQQASASSATAALIWRMPPDFDLDADYPQLYRTADLVAGALPDPSTEVRQGHWFANYGFTGAAATGGAGKYLDNDAGVARGFLAVAGTYSKMTMQVLTAQMERTTGTKTHWAGITDDETGITSSSWALNSYLNTELAFQPDQSSANESGLIDFYDKGAQILTHVVDTEGRVRRELFLNEMSVLFDHSSAPWAGVTFKTGLWMNGSTGSLIYDPTSGLKTRVYAVRFWNRALTYRETWQSVAEWRGEALLRGISLGVIRYVVIIADADSLSAWRAGAYDSWIYQNFRDADFNGELIVVNCANGGSGYDYLDGVGYEAPNGTSESFQNFERIRVLPAIRAAKQMGAFVIVFRADGTNNKNQIKAGGVAAYEAQLGDPSRAAIRAAGADRIFEHMTIARGGDAAFDAYRQALNARRFTLVGGAIDGVADITGTPMDSYAEATAAMTTGSLYFSTDGTHGTPLGQGVRAAAAKTLILGAIPQTYGLREDGGFELREDGGYEIRE